MQVRFWILVLCGVLTSVPAFAGVKIKNLEEYWATQRAYHYKKIEPNPDIWMAPTHPSADDSWVLPNPNATTGVAIVNGGGDSSSEDGEDFMSYQKEKTLGESEESRGHGQPTE